MVASVGAVISRSDTSQDNSTAPPDQSESARAVERPELGLTSAIVLAGAGAVLVGLAPLVGVVTPATSAGFPSWPLLLMLAALPPGIAEAFRRRQQPGLAAAVLFGPAVLAPGRLVLDAQLVVDAGLAARPELLVPHTLDPLSPGIGFWFLLTGHIVTGVAGLLALSSGHRVPESSSGSVFGSSETEEPAVSGARRQGLLALVLCATVVAAVGLLMAPFVSDNAFLLARAALDSPLLVLIGSLLVSLGVLSVGGFVASSADSAFARGGLLGLAAAIAGLSVPSLVATMLLPDLRSGWGAWLVFVAVAALALLSLPAGRPSRPEESRDFLLPGLGRLLAVAGVLALLAGVLAILGALAPQLEMPAGMGEPSPYPARMLWPAGVVLIMVGTGLLLPSTALWLRPALPVAAAVLPLSAAAALDTVLTAAQVTGAGAGTGAWAAGAGVVLVLIAAIVAVLAGGVERDDVDLTETSIRRPLAWPAAAGLVLAIGAFVLPILTAPGYTPPGVFTEFSMTSWGLVIALVSVVVAAALAPVCRPPRAAALLCGAALVVFVRVLELPLTAGRAEGAGPGAGLWSGLACIVVLLAAAALAARDARRQDTQASDHVS